MVFHAWTRRALVATAGLFSLAVAPTVAKDPLPPGTATKLLAADLDYLKKGFEKPPATKAVQMGLKSVAMNLAMNANNLVDGPDGAKMAGLRDQAVKIAEALEAGKAADAKKAADGLDSAPAGDPKKAVKLSEKAKVSLDEVMKVLNSTRAGGLNIENEFKDKEVDKTIKDAKKVELFAARIAIVGQYSLDLPSNEAVGAKKKKWDDWSKEMTTLASDLAAEAAKPAADAATLKKKIAAVNKNCTDCHNEFRK
jgi:hypothetical protein